MGFLVVTGAQCKCSFGTASSNLQVTSQTQYLVEGKPVATIQDMQPDTNIQSFGMCISLANPAVAAATAAALGVLTPMPCMVKPTGPWVPTNSKLMAAGIPCLTNEATLTCGLGAGTITITVPGQTKTQV